MPGICPCGAQLPPFLGKGRPRKYCTDCNPVRTRHDKPKVSASVTSLPAPERLTSTLEDAVRSELEAFGRADSPDGVAALYAARMLEAGGHTGSAASALLREMRASVTAATKGASTGADLVDELRAKRAKRRGA